ncbi:ABC transporter permease subunit [Cellulomonas sp. HZM]|uniref:ABC transporter permease subunit n=1 Tax=Cellulomonas sp. HZM TaxID=1454010 RepID=UPI0004938F7A|nr:ABC transporter permease subunit [Cellulomonas sp. HZM]
MTAATATAPVAAPNKNIHLSFPHVVRSEWIKLWTVRSTMWSLPIFFVVTVGLVLLMSLAFRSALTHDASDLPADLALQPFVIAMQMAQIALVVLAALAITGEYSTGMIRSSLTAAPRRSPVLWAKLVVLAAVFLVLSIVSVAIAFAVQQAIFSSDLKLDLGDSQVQRALLGAALYATTIALLSFALGALMRHSAAAIATVLGLILVLPILFQIPWRPLQLIQPFLPGVAGSLITETDAQIAQANDMAAHGVVQFTAWQGYGLLVGYVVLVLAAAWVRLKKTDA